jgi:hypothetical protein
VVQVWDAAAYRAAESIEQIVSSDTLHDSLWQNVRGFVHGLSKVMDWVGTVSGVLALVFVWLPPVSAAFGVVALGATAIKLVADVAIAANDHTGWGDVVWDAVGVVSFGAGRAVTRVAEGLSKVAVGTARQAANVSGRAGFAGLRAASGSRGALPTIRSLVGGAISRLSPKAAIGWVEGGVQVMRSSVVEGLNAYRLSSLWSDVRGLAHFSDELTYAGAWLTTELATMKSMGVVRALPGIFMRVLGEGGTAVNVAENVPSMAENVTALMQANGRALWKLEGVAMGAVNTGRQAIGYAVGAGAVVVGKVAGADVAAPLHSVVTYSGDSGPVETPVDRLNLK